MTGRATVSLAGVGPFAGASVADLSARLRRREVSATDLVRAFLTAAAEHGPALGCFVTVDEGGAMRAAVQADRELAAGLDRGPLQGIPVAVKDLIFTAGLRTTMGSRHFAGHVPATDAAAVAALRQAGAVVAAKTHTHEFAYGPTGDRAHTGPVRNPHDLSLMAGGSSGGSAAAVAAGLVPVALGTDTGGSVRIPAALCGTVGLRPTSGTVPSDGVFPLAPTLDTVGPIAAGVTDTALLWSVVAGKPVYTPDPGRIEDLRLARMRSELDDRVASEQRHALEEVLRGLPDAADVPVPEMSVSAAAYAAVQGAEAYAIHHERIDNAPELFDPEVLERLRSAAGIKGWEYVTALRLRERLRTEIGERLARIDVLIMPTVPIQAPRLGDRLVPGWDHPRDALLALTSPWSLLGFPAISVPVRPQGRLLPQSVQLIAKPGHENRLLDAASAVEALHTQGWTEPSRQGPDGMHVTIR
ncbi:amidase [Nonomuraea sp. NPDC050404]|uniref:amidase n=1 Tax=Nonomuraea sp. NPDC050404 TaxID=3155783 RepID=UPI0033C14C15